MKIKLLLSLGIISLFFMNHAISGCNGAYSYYNGSAYGASEFDNRCQCTDPACWRCYDRDCASMTTCCQAFGNVGAR